MTSLYDIAVQEIIGAGNRLDALNLAPATSGNYSVRTGVNEMAITVSGAHKGHLSPEQIMRADLDGKPLEGKKPSAETLLHCLIYKLYPEINAVLHTHSVACSVLTRVIAGSKFLELKGYEMLKAYPDIDTHDVTVRLPIFENTQDMQELSSRVEEVLSSKPKTPAYLIRGHGIYGWGADMAEALRIIEATEMMLNCEMHSMQIKG